MGIGAVKEPITTVENGVHYMTLPTVKPPPPEPGDGGSKGDPLLPKTYAPAYNPYQDMLDEMRRLEQERLERQRQQAQRQYDARVKNINQGTDEILRQAYISKMQSDRQTPQQLKALGISGGLSETTLQNMAANYQNNRNQTQAQRLQALDIAAADRDALTARSYEDFLQNNINAIKNYGSKFW